MTLFDATRSHSCTFSRMSRTALRSGAVHDPSPDAMAERLEALVDATGGIDRFCSGPDWTTSTQRTFAGDQAPIVLGEDGRWAATLVRLTAADGGTVLLGLDTMWGFACPLLLPDPAAHAPAVAEALADPSATPAWDRLVLTGFDPGTALVAHTARALSTFGPVLGGPGVTRCRADLSDGADAWLGRRSRRFRARLRRIREEAEAEGVSIAWVAEEADLLARLVAIEERSWKGQRDDGLVAPDMRRLYGHLIARLGARGRLRCAVATMGGRDVGYILGGVRAGIYRGFQLSYTTDVADLGVGHLLQWAQVQALEGEEVHTYDLGMDMPYKRRWADTVDPSLVLVVQR